MIENKMKQWLFLSLLLILCHSCARTEILNAPILVVDTIITKVDTTEVERIDTTRIPIGFQVSVSDWEEQEVTTLD